MAKQNVVLKLWNSLSGKPGGKWLFSRIICQKAPYFSSITPRFEQMAPGRVEISIRNKRAVHNHIGTVHAIAMCNMAELAGGTMTDISIPPTHRWIPKGMQVQYLAKAQTDLRAVAVLPDVPEWTAAQELITPVDIIDSHGTVVMHADINMWVTAKKSGPT